MKDFVPLVKVHLNNRLTHSVATHQILKTYPIEAMKKLGVKENVAERTLGFGKNRKILSCIA